ncbi:hypothetical protein COPEUT_01131 [Coprococcus eutactus ATCC 27759]|nr:hypothetical protein COPEUT_01131 [Coprococcus eutactus ATCC 27759]
MKITNTIWLTKIYKTCKLKNEGDKVQNEKKYFLLETCRRY